MKSVEEKMRTQGLTMKELYYESYNPSRYMSYADESIDPVAYEQGYIRRCRVSECGSFDQNDDTLDELYN